MRRVIVLFALLCVLAGCGGGSRTAITIGGGTPAAETPAVVPELADGLLRVGTDISFPPIEFFATGSTTPTGLDIDLASALAGQLGVRVEFVNTPFGNLIDRLTSGAFDIVMSGMTITDVRSQQLNFVAYFNAGTGILVQPARAGTIHTLQDLCGLRVAVQAGTVQVDLLNGAQCAQGAITVVPFDVASAALSALENGTVDALAEDFPTARFDASSGQAVLESAQFDVKPYGIGLRKSSSQLQSAISGALATLRSNGRYAEILAKYGLQAGSI